MSASSFKIQPYFYSVNAVFYGFAQYDKPFENETQSVEAFELHDEIYEILLKLPDEIDSFEIELVEEELILQHG